MSDKEITDTISNSTLTHTSYSLGSFFDDFLATTLSYMVFKFYETEVFLPIIYITIAVVIYGVWNMVNDPIAGRISDLNIGFMKRRGKRFTWFLLASIPCSLIFFLIFIPPVGFDLSSFLWLLVTLCLLDTFFSFMIINWQALFPDKYRSQKERTKVGGIQILFSLIGLSLGVLLPTLLITTNAPGTNIPSYITVGALTTIFCFIAVLLMIYGMKESKDMIERTFKPPIDTKIKESYLKSVKFAFQQKNFVAYLTAYLAQTSVMGLMLASVPYWVQYVLSIDPFYEMLILVVFLLSSVCSAPIWIKLARRYGNRIGYMCGTLGTASFLCVTLFIWSFPLVIIGFVLIGFSMGATWSLIYATFSDVIDEIVVKTGARDEGTFYGLRTFFGRLSIVIQALTFGIIHPLTSFDPTSPTQSIQAQWGINIGMFLVPAIFYFIGFLFMWRVYDLTSKKVELNKKKLVELEL